MKKLILSIFAFTICLCAISQNVDKSKFITHYEANEFNNTPRYKQTVDYCNLLAENSDWISITSIGKSPHGRDIPMLIIDKDGIKTPEQARKKGKAIVLVEACIHTGEPDGKDAGMMLIRDIAVFKQNAEILDNVTLLFIPILNVDGHEFFSEYNRINQNGPRELGTRATAQRLNMNRDFLKADCPETQLWLKMYNYWLPELFMDIHVTNGADFQYVITYSFDDAGFMDDRLKQWNLRVIDKQLNAKMTENGYPMFPYFRFKKSGAPEFGIFTEPFAPQYSNGYASAHNRLGLLVENHIYKPYKQRVDATYKLIYNTLDVVNKNHKELISVINEIDKTTASPMFRKQPLALNYIATQRDSVLCDFLSWERKTVKSDLSGADWTTHDYNAPITVKSWIYTYFEPTVEVRLPDKYIVSAENLKVIDLLNLHGIETSIIEQDMDIEVETYRFTTAQWSKYPNEGHNTVNAEFTTQKEIVTYPKGSVIVDMNQQRARVIAHLLEPKAPSSLVYWGFFDPFVRPSSEFWISLGYMEVKGREMMEKDPELRRVFEAKKASDSSFASNPQAILQFFMTKLRENVEKNINLYPVGRIFKEKV